MSRRRPAAPAPPPQPAVPRDPGEPSRVHIAPAGYAALAGECAAAAPGQAIILVADTATWAAAGERVRAALVGAGQRVSTVCVFPAGIRAEWAQLEEVEYLLIGNRNLPVAVGAGTLTDLVKLAAHRTGRACLVAATAASMDGYAAAGASLERDGDKRTHDCPPPRAVAVDLEVLAAAPPALAAAGYADLLAKVVAGADWLLADALGVEAIQPRAWELAQDGLRQRLAAGAAPAELIHGLIRSGQAMHAAGSSRPASGAEHQFSHLWDMEGIGRGHLHGCKVGIGTLAAAHLHAQLLATPVAELEPERCAAAWPGWAEEERRLRALQPPALRAVALAEGRAKHPDRAAVAARLRRLQAAWPTLRPRLAEQLMPLAEVRRRLAEAGAPLRPEAVGVPRARLREAYAVVRSLRRRWTILDLAAEAGWLATWTARAFAAGGPWAER